MPPFGVEHPNYHKVPWPANLKQSKIPINIPSSFIELLGHNDSPTTAGLSLVREFEEIVSQGFSGNATRRSDVLGQIRRLQDELGELKLSNERLEKQSFVCKVITSPFRRLPNDILYNVVAHCPRLYPSNCLNSTPKTHVPSVLAGVSKLWRTCVLGQSALWKDTRLCCIEWHKQPRAVRRRLNLFIERSASSGGLNLELHACESQEEHFSTALNWISYTWSKSNQIEHLTLEPIMPPTVLKAFTGNTSHKLQFKSLELQHLSDNFAERVTWHSFTSILSRFPYLRHLWLSYSEGFWFEDIATVPITTLAPWLQLTVLHLDNAFDHISGWYSCLRACSNLKAARLRVCPDDTGTRTTHSPIAGSKVIHHHLEYLSLQVSDPTIRDESESAVSILFVGTKFPKLKVLHLYFSGDIIDDLPSRSPGCLRGVFPNLEELHIPRPWDKLPKTWASLHPLFLAVPTITTLSHILSPQLLLEFQSYLQDSHFPFSHLARISLQFIGCRYNWLDEDSKGTLSESLIEIRRWQISTLGGTSASGSSNMTDMTLATRTSMKISFTWHDSLDDESVIDSIHDVEGFVENLEERCREEKFAIEVEFKGDEPSGVWDGSGSELFRELHFSSHMKF